MMFKLAILLPLILLMLFYVLQKSEKWESNMGSIFECGFTSYYFSRFSFSIHYYLIALIFLFLDLEICFMLPFFSFSCSNFNMVAVAVMFLVALLLGLLEEWKEKKLDIVKPL